MSIDALELRNTFVLMEDDQPIFLASSYKKCVDYLLDIQYSDSDVPEYDYYSMLPGRDGVTHIGYIDDYLYEIHAMKIDDRFPKLYADYGSGDIRDFCRYLFIDENTCMNMKTHKVENRTVKGLSQQTIYDDMIYVEVLNYTKYWQGSRVSLENELEFAHRLETEFRHVKL